VGDAALRLGQLNPSRAVHSVKRLLGLEHVAAGPELPRSHGSLALVPAAEGGVRLQVGLRAYAPGEIAAHVLRKLKDAAEVHLGEPVTGAVLTVPTSFEAAEQQSLRDAALLAGLQVPRLVTSPVAVALSHALKTSSRAGECLVVCDVGGGSFGVTVLQESEGLLRVRAAAGDAGLGGDEFDQRVVNWLTREFAALTSIDLAQHRMAQPRLRQAAEAAKRELSVSEQASIALPHIAADGSGPRSLETVLTRPTYDELTRVLLEWTADICRSCLAEARLAREQVGQVLLVGGQSRDPRVAELMRGVFGRPARRVVDDGVAAMGAAVQAGILEGALQELVRPD
jgi:molecular chaperone DnaK